MNGACSNGVGNLAVIPAEAGIQIGQNIHIMFIIKILEKNWIPAFAGMTNIWSSLPYNTENEPYEHKQKGRLTNLPSLQPVTPVILA